MSLPAAIGGYAIKGELGRGGMGVVYEVEPVACPGARYALKLLLSQDERDRERLRREGALLGQIGSHPNVVRVHATGEDRGRSFLVLDLVAGGSLAARIARGPLLWARAIEVAEGVARALEKIHALGILHRDLKPSNILLDEDGSPRVTDFGIAHAQGLERLTRTGNVVGTIDYLAPELLGASGGHDARTDIYALGLCLYEALTGARPFVASSIVELVRLVEEGSVVPPGDRVEGIPASLDGLVLRMLARDPADRPASAREVAEELAAIRLGKHAARRRFAFALVALGAACALMLAALGVAWGTPPPPVEDGPSEHERELAARARELAARRPPRTSSAAVDARSAIERARVARGAENPASYTAIDDPAPLVRHAQQVYESLSEARRDDPSVELPADLVAFIGDSAQACARKREIESAARLLEEAIELDPTNVNLLLEGAYFEQDMDPGRWDRTLAFSLAALGSTKATAQQRIRAYGLAIQAHQILDQPEGAHALLDRAVAEFPDNPDILVRQARRQIETRDPAAVDTARRILELPGPLGDPHHERMRLLARALLVCRSDAHGALDLLHEIRGRSEWAADDNPDDIALATRCQIALGDKKAALRAVQALGPAADRARDRTWNEARRQLEAQVRAMSD